MSSVKFYSVASFKSKVGAETIRVVFNENTKKISALADDSTWFKCQQNIDLKKQLAFLVEGDNTQGACLVNVSTKSPLKDLGAL
jgi:hypothetical protein